MLDFVTLEAPVSSPLDFPSLTYLSLWGYTGLKSHINAPCLTTYHEGGGAEKESFPAPLYSLVEFGVYCPRVNYSQWHYSFPSLSRLSMRLDSSIFISFLDFLSNHRNLFPALQTISAGPSRLAFVKEDQEVMIAKVRDLNVMLHFEVGAPYHIPMFFGQVGHRPSDCLQFLTAILAPRTPYVMIVGPCTSGLSIKLEFSLLFRFDILY
jgi:hypothetical protein